MAPGARFPGWMARADTKAAIRMMGVVIQVVNQGFSGSRKKTAVWPFSGVLNAGVQRLAANCLR